MRFCSLLSLLVTVTGLAALAGCPGGNGGIGDRCDSSGDCTSSLQCVDATCVAQCNNAPDCGAGFSCTTGHYCQAATGTIGQTCASEVDCEAGLSCELSGATDAVGNLSASCAPSSAGRPDGASCVADGDCHNNLCALGRCVDLCDDPTDCGTNMGCMQIPRVEAAGALFRGCLQNVGRLAWSMPMAGPEQTLALPMPSAARSVAVTMTVGDPAEAVGVTRLLGPDGSLLVDPSLDPYLAPVRHMPGLGESVLAMPSAPQQEWLTGVYQMTVSSLKPAGDGSDGSAAYTVGTATPTVTAVYKLDLSVVLDLHFYFLNFDDFPCAGSPSLGADDDTFVGGTFGSAQALASVTFQNQLVDNMKPVLAVGGAAIDSIDYTDLRDHGDLDGLDIANAGLLLALGTHPDGINIFFVRSLAPAGLQAYSPNPGPAGLAGTAQSGIIIALDTLCYRDWTQVARITEHEIARYMGLYDNVEADSIHVDPLLDTDTSSSNLLFYSELGGTELTGDQREILSRSVVDE